jgi:hypothetical protein
LNGYVEKVERDGIESKYSEGEILSRMKPLSFLENL